MGERNPRGHTRGTDSHLLDQKGPAQFRGQSDYAGNGPGEEGGEGILRFRTHVQQGLAA